MEIRDQGLGYSGWDTGCMFTPPRSGIGFGVWGAGLRFGVYGLGFRIKGLGFKVWALGFKV